MKLRKYLDENGIKHNHFAHELGMHTSCLCRYLCGHDKIPQKYWMKIIAYTNYTVTMQDLFEGEEIDQDKV